MKIRNWYKKLSTTLAAVGLAGGGSLAQADTSTTLTGLTAAGNVLVPVNHGSNAEATLTWDANFQQYGTENEAGGWNGRGNVYQMEGGTQQLAFAPTAGNISLTLASFFLDEYAGGGNTFSDWSVTGSSSGLLASGTWALRNTANDPGDAGGRDLISPNATGTPGETLTLLFTNPNETAGGGSDSYLAMDNLVFSTAVIPEPATAVMAWLGVGGLGALAMRRKRS